MSNPDMDALYILTPESWIVDCLMADFEVRRYRRAILVWTSCQWAIIGQRRSTLANDYQSLTSSNVRDSTDLKWRVSVPQTLGL
jgi:hypothetical protein